MIDFSARIANDKSEAEGDVVIEEVKGWLVTIGEGDVLPCLEMAIRFMETGQTSVVWSHSKYALGNGTRTYTNSKGEKVQLPPHTNLLLQVKVVMFVMDTSRLNPYFNIQKATTRKSIANDIYQHEWCPAPKSAEEPLLTYSSYGNNLLVHRASPCIT